MVTASRGSTQCRYLWAVGRPSLGLPFRLNHLSPGLLTCEGGRDRRRERGRRMEENSGWWLDREYTTPSHTHTASSTIPPHLCPESRSSPALWLHHLLEEMAREGWLTSGSPLAWVTLISQWESSAGGCCLRPGPDPDCFTNQHPQS